MNGALDDERFTIPASDENAPPAMFRLLGEGEQPSEPPEEETFPLGAMGLPVGHTLTYLYDFGDWNVFKIKVTAVHPRAPRTRYPRVTAQVGKAPAQYPSW